MTFADIALVRATSLAEVHEPLRGAALCLGPIGTMQNRLTMIALIAVASMLGGCDADELDAQTGAAARPERGALGKADLIGSCEAAGELLCGGKSDGECWCDDRCAEFGDCCSDYEPVCLDEELVFGAPQRRAEGDSTFPAGGLFDLVGGPAGQLELLQANRGTLLHRGENGTKSQRLIRSGLPVGATVDNRSAAAAVDPLDGDVFVVLGGSTWDSRFGSRGYLELWKYRDDDWSRVAEIPGGPRRSLQVQVDDAGAIHVVMMGSVSNLRGTGRPHVTYLVYTDSRQQRSNLQYAVRRDGEWVVSTALSDARISGSVDLALTSEGTPVLGYDYWTGTRETCIETLRDGSWSEECIPGASAASRTVSLDVDTQDRPHLAWADRGTRTIRYARRLGSQWELYDATDGRYSDAALVAHPPYTDLELDEDGRPRIAFGHLDLSYVSAVD